MKWDDFAAKCYLWVGYHVGCKLDDCKVSFPDRFIQFVISNTYQLFDWHLFCGGSSREVFTHFLNLFHISCCTADNYSTITRHYDIVCTILHLQNIDFYTTKHELQNFPTRRRRLIHSLFMPPHRNHTWKDICDDISSSSSSNSNTTTDSNWKRGRFARIHARWRHFTIVWTHSELGSSVSLWRALNTVGSSFEILS